MISTATVEFSRNGESKFNSQLNWENSLYLYHDTCCRVVTPIYRLSWERLKRVENCNSEKPKTPLFDCVDQFLVSKSSCDIPWLKKHTPQDIMKNCTSEQIKQHFDLNYDIIKQDDVVIKELQKFGCLMDNCVEDIWKAQDVMKEPLSGENDTTFAIFEVKETKVNNVFYVFYVCFQHRFY